MAENKNHEYLGDGVYAEFDGHGLQLRANDHRDELCTDRIYLEDGVIHSLVTFWQRMVEANKNE